MIYDSNVNMAVIYFIANAKTSDIESNGIIFTCGITDEEAIYTAKCYLDFNIQLPFTYTDSSFYSINYFDNFGDCVTIEVLNLMFEIRITTIDFINRDFKLKQLINI